MLLLLACGVVVLALAAVGWSLGGIPNGDRYNRTW